MTQPKPTPAARLEKLAAGIGRIPGALRRAEAANALLDAIPAFAAKLRSTRAKAILELKEDGRTWAEVGELFHVSPQRAQQLSTDLEESSQ